MLQRVGAAVALVTVVGGSLACSGALAQQVAQQGGSETAIALPDLDVVQDKAAKRQGKAKVNAKAKAAAQLEAAPSAKPTPQGSASEKALTGTGTKAIQNYVASGSSVGTKADTPLKETPQSITVVGKEQMRDQGVTSVQQAVRYVPGVIADGFGFDTRNDFSIIRGNSTDYFIDGLRKTYGFYVTTIPVEPYALDRIEVLRGPSSMLYGQTPTGGMINGTSKLPLDFAYNEIGVDYGSFDFKQVRFDSSGPLTKDGKWLYRITGLARDADTQVDQVVDNRLMLQPSLTYKPTSATSISVLGHFRNDDTGSTQQFLPIVGTLVPTRSGQKTSRSTFIGEPGDTYETDAQSGTLVIDHAFDPDFKLHHASRYSHTANDYYSSYGAVLTPARISFINNALFGGLPVLNVANAPYLDAAQTEMVRARTESFNDTDVFNSDTYLNGKITTGPLRHSLTAGFDIMRYDTIQDTSGTLLDNVLTTTTIGIPIQEVFSPFNPTQVRSSQYLSLSGGLVSPDAVPLLSSGRQIQTDKGVYAQDQVRLGPLLGTFGVRQDWLTIEQEQQATKREEATTWRAALMYETVFGLSPYVSYATNFTPQAGAEVGESIYTPVSQRTSALPLKGEQWEVGFKYEASGVPFGINAAYYNLTEENQLVNPDVLFGSVQGATQAVRGFEVEAHGAVTTNLKVIASYAYTDARYEKYPLVGPGYGAYSAFMVGKPVDTVPVHSAALWAVYTFDSGVAKGFSFGAGVRYVGEADSYGLDLATGASQHIVSPSYTLFDAMVAYDTKDWRWQLTGQNLEDELYFTSCTVRGQDCGVGQARTLLTSFTYKF